LLNQIICLIFILDSLRARLQCGLLQGCGAIVTMTQLRLKSCFFSWTWRQLQMFMVFMSVTLAQELSFFMAPALGILLQP